MPWDPNSEENSISGICILQVSDLNKNLLMSSPFATFKVIFYPFSEISLEIVIESRCVLLPTSLYFCASSATKITSERHHNQFFEIGNRCLTHLLLPVLKTDMTLHCKFNSFLFQNRLFSKGLFSVNPVGIFLLHRLIF